MFESSTSDWKLSGARGSRGQELLDPLVLLDLARVEVSLRVQSNGIDPVELARVGAIAPEVAERLATLPVENPDLVVGSVSHVHVLLLRVARQHQFVRRPA